MPATRSNRGSAARSCAPGARLHARWPVSGVKPDDRTAVGRGGIGGLGNTTLRPVRQFLAAIGLRGERRFFLEPLQGTKKTPASSGRPGSHRHQQGTDELKKVRHLCSTFILLRRCRTCPGSEYGSRTPARRGNVRPGRIPVTDPSDPAPFPPLLREVREPAGQLRRPVPTNQPLNATPPRLVSRASRPVVENLPPMADVNKCPHSTTLPGRQGPRYQSQIRVFPLEA